MITTLEKVKTRVAIIHNIPKKFFEEIEASVAFGDHLFPSWANTVFAPTDLKAKFRAVYNKYKSIKTKVNRDRIVNTFIHSNQIENLCANTPGVLMITLDDLPASIRKDIDKLFLYLYNTAVKYHGFETYVNDTVRESINRFIVKNKMVVCPFCALESYTNIEGQARLPLDHWLNKDKFPMVSVNFNNLVPIGKDCNPRPAKGDKNVLVDQAPPNARITAYYPYQNHGETNPVFNFVNEPSVNPIADADWTFSLTPNNPLEQNIFDNWVSTMNITTRYLDYFRKNIFPMWENDYIEFINDPDNNYAHAQNILELKANFGFWRSTFKTKARPGAFLYRSFIDYLINRASNAYLQGLCDNFRA
jgi:hypothetical protein